MTNQEAIKQLNGLRDHVSEMAKDSDASACWKYDAIALKMAIRALERDNERQVHSNGK